MKLDGFIGAAYTLKTVNVDCQNCVNLYPEMNEAGKGKEQEVAWLRSTPGHETLLTVGDGPIRCIHHDDVGRVWVVSGQYVYWLTYSVGVWTATQISAPFDIIFTANATTSKFTATNHHYVTGTQVNLTSTGTLPTGLATDTTYWTIFIDANTFQLATSSANALAGIFITISNAGSGVHTAHVNNATSQFLSSTGIVSAASGPVGESDASSTVFVDGTNSYAYFDTGFPADSVFQIYSGFGYASAPNADHVIFVDGYFLFSSSDAYLWCSDLNNFNVNPLSFAGSEGDPDNLIAIISNQRDVWLLNERSTELFNDTGNVDFPFERVSGGFIEKGILSKFSVAKLDGVVFWLGRDNFGQGVVYMGQGLLPQRISTHSIETAIQSYATPSDAVAFTYQSGGHSFYVLNFDEATWVYDLATGMWHQRGFLNNGILERNRGQVAAFIPEENVLLVGDYSNNKVYQFNDDYYMDDGNPIQRQRTSPHISNGLKRIFYGQLQLDMETGVGLSSGQGSDPQVVMQYSNDGGHTFSDESWASAGKQIGGIGQFKTRVVWRKLGKARDRIFRITITDPVKVALISAELELQLGNS